MAIPMQRSLMSELNDDVAPGISDQDRIEHLEIGMASARRIGIALGILMNARKITEEDAFAALRVASQHSNRKLRDIADHVVATGQLPQ
jgi:AmiR/NasT family two-component response regulator